MSSMFIPVCRSSFVMTVKPHKRYALLKYFVDPKYVFCGILGINEIFDGKSLL